MALCSMQTGVLFWKKMCGQPAAGHCSQCSRIVCARHGSVHQGATLCSACYREETGDSDSGSWFTWSSGGAASAAAAASGTAAGGDSWHGDDSGGSSDSGGSDSGSSSDSGGGDSGGSSSD